MRLFFSLKVRHISQSRHYLKITAYFRATDYSAKPLMNMSCLLYRIMSSSSVCWVIFHQAHWDYLVLKGNSLIPSEVEEWGFNSQSHSANQLSSLIAFSIPAQTRRSAYLRPTLHLPPTCHLQTPSEAAFDVVFAPMYSRG